MPETEYPSNSLLARKKEESTIEAEEPTKKLAKVVTGIVKRKKKSWLATIKQTVFGEDAENIGSYIIWDILVPAAKDMIYETVKQAIQMRLYGEQKLPDRLQRDRGRTVVTPYNSIYGSRERPRFDRREPSRNTRTIKRVDDIVVPTRADAEEVLASLLDMIEQYDVATVANLYDLVGLPDEFTDHKFGWDNLSTTKILRVSEGWILDLPKAYPLN